MNVLTTVRNEELLFFEEFGDNICGETGAVRFTCLRHTIE